MIKLEREFTKEAIPVGLRGKRRINRHLKLLGDFRAGKLEIGSKYWKRKEAWKSAKKQLKKESHAKCAYCESQVAVVAPGDVEHFRPKSRYWWLAYCYDNYLFACQICNGHYKSDNFPFSGQMMAINPPLPDPFPTDITDNELRTIASQFSPDPLIDAEGLPRLDFITGASSENPHLIDPYIIDPEPFFKWIADPTEKQVAIAPRTNSTAVRQVFAAVEQYLGLNRVELLRLRWVTYNILRTLKDVLESERINADLHNRVKGQIKAMMADDANYAGMVRYFVRDQWQCNLEV